MGENFIKRLKSKAGIGIMEVLVAAVVLGFLYVALNKLQGSNHEATVRLRSRDVAIEVSQQVMDSLKAVGAAAIPSCDDKDTTITLGNVTRKWSRSLSGNLEDTVRVDYTPTITVSPTSRYEVKGGSLLTSSTGADSLKHVYAKQVDIKIEWPFKGTTQKINTTGVIR